MMPLTLENNAPVLEKDQDTRDPHLDPASVSILTGNFEIQGLHPRPLLCAVRTQFWAAMVILWSTYPYQ